MTYQTFEKFGEWEIWNIKTNKLVAVMASKSSAITMTRLFNRGDVTPR